jgi:hypothetical protein
MSAVPGPLAGLLDELHRTTRAELVVLKGELRLIGDRSQVSDDLRARLHAVREELLEHLTPRPCAGCGRFFFPEPNTLCFWCRQRTAKR